uniref:Ubiquitin carboxyl-terminal hydrolase n=1 Tax=Panagrellus redivivus TaxID=6233 RepID=A0A7E4ZSY7_PANRE
MVINMSLIKPEAVETVEPPQAEVLLRDVDPVMPSQLRSRITSAIFSNMEGSIASRRGKRSTAGGTSFAVAKRVRGRGLPNSGNTCYINSVLQSLCSTVVFKTSVTDVRDFLQNHCNATEEYLARVMPLSTSLCELFRNFLFSTKEDLTQVLLNVKNSVAKFPSNRQEDAHEFLTFMLDRLKKEYEAAKEDVTDPQKLESFPPEPVDTCFGHTIQRQFTCQTCFNVRSKKDVETFFIVDIGDKHRNSVCLSDIIQGSLREEIVDRRCSTKNCNGEKANMMSYISQIPEVFIILIRRYSYSSGEQSKRKDKILMEEKMSVVCEPQGDEPTRYSIDCLDHDYLMHRNFRILLAMFHGEGLPRSNISYQRVADDVDLHDSYVSFLMALTNQKTSFVRFVEKHLCDHLSGNAEKYAPLMNQTEPEFRRGINKCKHGTSLPTTLDLLACASVFKTNFWAFNGKRYVKFPPLAGNVAEPGDIFISPEMVVDFKNIKNRKFIYMLNSIVCHTGEKSEKGHYESLIRSPLDDEWLECNDNVVKEPNNRNVFIKSAETAYIMLYTQSRE